LRAANSRYLASSPGAKRMGTTDFEIEIYIHIEVLKYE